METGHSYLPNDRDFADVSRALKHQNQVVSPEQWYDLVRNARLRNPFKVRELKRENFISLNGLDRHLINRRKNEDHNGVEWLKIKAMKFEKGSLFMYYKYSLKDDDIWMKVDMCRNKRKRSEALEFLENYEPCLAYSEERCITKEKKTDLMKLLDYIPPIYHRFYKSLKTDNDHVDEHLDILDTDTEENLEEENSRNNAN